MLKTPKSLRLHIAILGRRNVGKSSVLNALTGQDVAIVSEVAGTTTDPVEKPMELLPLGPVLFIDTAGFDDMGSLGQLRIERTSRILERADVALLVTEADTWGEYEEKWSRLLRESDIPVLVILNKADSREVTIRPDLERAGAQWTVMSAVKRTGVLETKEAIIRTVPESWYKQAGILDGLAAEHDTVVLVIPIDKEAPKGRIILPQVQTIRDLLDRKANAFVTNEVQLPVALEQLREKPRLVVTDSQAFEEVARSTPADIPMTSFSILFARFKGDLESLVDGVKSIERLRGNERILISEACTHHPIGDDIGRKKIPNWLRAKAGQGLDFDVLSGHDFPPDLDQYSLVVHCGACMLNRREMLTRILRCRQAGVPITNYGLAIAASLGILERALQPFPEIQKRNSGASRTSSSASRKALGVAQGQATDRREGHETGT
jgi:[FeFe] hydrogenase H-cluster maturation GTPase HydF